MKEEKIKIFHANNQTNYSSWLGNVEIVHFIEDCDLVFFEGGSDVTPSIYNSDPNDKTYFDRARDIREIEIYSEAIKLNKACLGICRGSQLLTALQPNGRLIQDITDHGIWGGHPIEFNDGTVLSITSTHHQMMYPFGVKNYELIAWSSPSRSKHYEFGPNNTVYVLPEDREPEIVFYPKTKCLAIQGHPEMMKNNCETIVKLRELVKEKLKL